MRIGKERLEHETDLVRIVRLLRKVEVLIDKDKDEQRMTLIDLDSEPDVDAPGG